MLGVFCREMNNIDVPYEFMEWTSPVEYPYTVGEYSEIPTLVESGYKEGTMVLTTTTKGSWLELEQTRQKIANHFPSIHGLRLPTDIGTVVFYYSNAFPVPTGEAELKRIQINIDVKEWRNTQ